MIAVALFGSSVLLAGLPAYAADWSDTSISWRYGSKFAEPYETNDISKNIFALTHVSGYKYGINFFNLDMLMSDSKDPSNAHSTDGAQEAYVVYRNTLDLGKITGSDFKFSVVKDVGATFGFDWNAKTDAGYNSKKRMLVLGPTLMFDVPGFLNVSLLALWESNAPCNTYSATCVSRYRYKTHPMLTAAWGIPIGASAFSFEGFMNYIASKGTDEFGATTKPETNFDGQIMADIGKLSGGPKDSFKLGLEYQYWKNKFGNDASGPAGSGAFAKTPMVRAEYHF
ncbi:MAG: outer envelope protein [Gammaproteobacteria bacterium]|nr:outer envelope protein [Gammaproteobacteria bacterium]